MTCWVKKEEEKGTQERGKTKNDDNRPMFLSNNVTFHIPSVLNQSTVSTKRLNEAEVEERLCQERERED